MDKTILQSIVQTNLDGIDEQINFALDDQGDKVSKKPKNDIVHNVLCLLNEKFIRLST